MADKELEQQNRTLKELVDNQKETNKTLVTGFSALQKSGTEDSTFMSKNLGSLMEVAATMQAVKTQIAHEKKEEMTEVDEKVEKLTEEQGKEGKKSRNLLRTIADFSTKGYDKGVVAASKATEMAREGSQKLQKLGQTIVKGVTKGFRETWGSMTKVAKKLTFAGVIFAAFMIAFMNFLGSDFFNKGFSILRDKIIPAIGKVWEIMKSIGGHLATFFGPLFKDIMAYFESNEYGSGQKSIGQIFTDNLFASLVGIAALAILLSPKMLFAGLIVGGTWKAVTLLGAAVAGIAGVLSAVAMQITNMTRMALGLPAIGSAAALAAARVKGPQKGATFKMKGAGPKGTTSTMKFTGKEWVNQAGKAVPDQPGVQKAFTQKMTDRMFGAGGKLGARGRLFLKAAKRLGPVGLAVTAGLSSFEAWNIMETMQPGKARDKALGDILYGTLGTLGMVAIGAGLGTLAAGPLGGIIGGMAAGWHGDKIGIYLANWLMGGNDIKPPDEPTTYGGGLSEALKSESFQELPGGAPKTPTGSGFGLKGGARSLGGLDMPWLPEGAGGLAGRFSPRQLDKAISMIAAGKKVKLTGTEFGQVFRHNIEKLYRPLLRPEFDPDFIGDKASIYYTGKSSIIKAEKARRAAQQKRWSGPTKAEKDQILIDQGWVFSPTHGRLVHPMMMPGNQQGGSPVIINNQDQSVDTTNVIGQSTVPTGFIARVLGWISLPAAPLNTSSDIRLKEDIELIDKSPSGINIYSFKYIGEEEKYQGVMAQEVLWASTPDEKGYYSVDYSKLDVDFIKLN